MLFCAASAVFVARFVFNSSIALRWFVCLLNVSFAEDLKKRVIQGHKKLAEIEAKVPLFSPFLSLTVILHVHCLFCYFQLKGMEDYFEKRQIQVHNKAMTAGHIQLVTLRPFFCISFHFCAGAQMPKSSELVNPAFAHDLVSQYEKKLLVNLDLDRCAMFAALAAAATAAANAAANGTLSKREAAQKQRQAQKEREMAIEELKRSFCNQVYLIRDLFWIRHFDRSQCQGPHCFRYAERRRL